MKAVILAGGKGSRMRELTASRPKPMLTLRGKNLIEHKLDALPEYITEVIIVTGYLGHVIREYFGSKFGRFSISYEEQTELNGTGGALWLAKDRLNEPFLVLMGDDVYDKADLESLCMHQWAVLAKSASGTHSGGRIVQNSDGTVAQIIEGTHEGENMLINTAAYVLQPEIFTYNLVPKEEGSSEFGLPQTIATAIQDHTVHVVETNTWLQLTSPEDLAAAEQATV